MGSRLELVLVWARGNKVWPLIRCGVMHWLVGWGMAGFTLRRNTLAEVGQMGSERSGEFLVGVGLGSSTGVIVAGVFGQSANISVSM